MNFSNANTTAVELNCETASEEISAYLDGAMSGVEIAALAHHLGGCEECASEFAAWRDVQTALGELGRALPPARLQARLRAALAVERERGTYLSYFGQFALAWKQWLASAALRV